MIFDDPISLSDAVKILLAKNIMPTALDTAGLRQLDASLLNQSFFSAQTLYTWLLELYRERITGILHPVPVAGESTTQFSPAYVRAAAKKLLAEVGYEPAPGDAGTLKDLSSDARINLVIKTNVQMAQGQGLWMRTQQPALLAHWPAWELFRAEGRVHPRFWLERWQQAGAATGDPIGIGWTITSDERLIALKNHAIWGLIGSSELFKDGLDTPWPPFAFNSGMWVRDIERAICVAIGLLKPGQTVAPKTLADVLPAMKEAA